MNRQGCFNDKNCGSSYPTRLGILKQLEAAIYLSLYESRFHGNDEELMAGDMKNPQT